MLTSHIVTPEIIDRLPHEGYRYVVSIESSSDPVQILAKWPWVGVLSSHVTSWGTAVPMSSDAPVFTSDRERSPHTDATATTTLACDAPGLALPAGGSQTGWSCRATPIRSGSRRCRSRVPLPPVGVIYSRGAGELRCQGAASIDAMVTPS